MNSKRRGTIIESNVPKNTVVDNQSQWRQFSEFGWTKNYKSEKWKTTQEIWDAEMEQIINSL